MLAIWEQVVRTGQLCIQGCFFSFLSGFACLTIKSCILFTWSNRQCSVHLASCPCSNLNLETFEILFKNVFFYYILFLFSISGTSVSNPSVRYVDIIVTCIYRCILILFNRYLIFWWLFVYLSSLYYIIVVSLRLLTYHFVTSFRIFYGLDESPPKLLVQKFNTLVKY